MKAMGKKELSGFEELGNLSPHYKAELKWKHSCPGGGAVRLETRGGFVYCPLTAVCRRVTKKRLPSCDFKKAGKLLGLRESVARNMAYAADAVLCYNSDIRGRYRRRMIEVLGL